jgi:hypothetical protein
MGDKRGVGQPWLILGGALAFAAGLGAVVGSRLIAADGLAVALGVALGVLVGVPVGVGAALAVLQGRGGDALPGGDDTTTVVMPAEQARQLIKMLNSRQQAEPEAFPLVSEGERSFSTVGGAAFDETYED